MVVTMHPITASGAIFPCSTVRANPTKIPERDKGRVRGLAALIHAPIVLMTQRYKFPKDS
jgi:hypothetical protein